MDGVGVWEVVVCECCCMQERRFAEGDGSAKDVEVLGRWLGCHCGFLVRVKMIVRCENEDIY